MPPVPSDEDFLASCYLLTQARCPGGLGIQAREDSSSCRVSIHFIIPQCLEKKDAWFSADIHRLLFTKPENSDARQ
jgi:hypothetical protein